MQIILQKNLSDKKRIGKVINEIRACTGILRSSSSLLEPTITIAGDMETLSEINYFYIPAFKRHYFITNITSLRNNFLEITGKVDVLESFASQILANSAVIERQENNYNMYLNDPDFMTYNYRRINTKLFPSGFPDTSYYYLTVAGGWSNL